MKTTASRLITALTAVLAVAGALLAAPPPSAAAPAGSFPVTIVNNTRGTWSDAQVYVTVMGMSSPGQWAYLRTDGTLRPIDHDDENAPGHLTKNGRNYANMSFTLAQARTFPLPPRIEGARMYLSYGQPMYFPISPDDRGWGGPDVNNPGDPNLDVYFDWYEFTYVHGLVPFGGNTTQVDLFGFPMTARLTQTAIGYDQTIGLTLTRDEVRSRFTQAVSGPFDGLMDSRRILAPRSSPAFRPGGAHAGFLQGYIDAVWNQYANSQFTLTRLNQTFTGRVSGGRLQFTKDGAGPFYLNKPSSADVLSCSGALASPGMAVTELELGAEFCAAFNRGVAARTSDWWRAASYYAGSPDNEYSAFFHTVSIANRAYGFPYDDVNDQSSVKILPNANPPTSLTITAGW
ncbi:glycoside hydrolase family 64 protein [Phytomonospora sp. NPDC050363]|uniref:glycoside hydrolase family 64 protein n=1 Tax=Phytomonospora sp. NPDC050363 TaxID=3155642 RepID=UPI0033D3CEBF